MCHSESGGLGTFPIRPDSGEFADHYPIESPRSAVAEAQLLADMKAAERLNLCARIREVATAPGPCTPREVRELAAACVRESQRPPGKALDLGEIMVMYRRYRDLVAHMFLDPVQAAMISASLNVSEMQGLDMEAPKAEAPKPPRRRMEDECPDCGTVMDKEFSDDGPIWKCQCGTEESRNTHPTPDEAYERARDRDSSGQEGGR